MFCLPIFSRRTDLTLIVLLLAICFGSTWAGAASLRINWQDNSSNEDGFRIERSVDGNYVQIASVGANTQSYTDSGLPQATTYCYRVRAFNSNGVSAPSNESCGTTPAVNYTLNMNKSGDGTGLVSSNPAGIYCGTDCSENYPSGTIVYLTAKPERRSDFAGWAGDADCADGKVTMDTNKSCTAVFKRKSLGHNLMINIAGNLGTNGIGTGKVTSNPAGINCQSDCSETYSLGTTVYLSAIPDLGSAFAGWAGDADCVDGKVTMDTEKFCTAMFTTGTVTLSVARNGPGTVYSNPVGINCGNNCSLSVAPGSKVTLSAQPGPNSTFAGWSGGGCQGLGDCTVSLMTNATVTAIFVGPNPMSIGLFRPATGEWFLDKNRNGVWDGCNIDTCLRSFGGAGDIPVAGDWSGKGTTTIGVFRPSTGEWFLDFNANGQWDGCDTDRCLRPISSHGTLPVVGDWTGAGITMIGEMLPGRTSHLYLDLNGNGIFDNCETDACLSLEGDSADHPVAGDWKGTGTAKVGVFRSSTGEWFLDFNPNGRWDGCNIDKCLKSNSMPGDLPVVGDWAGTGTAKLGLFRPSTGEWFLDLNGNERWDGCSTDGCIKFMSYKEGDLPVVGAW